MNKPIFIAEVKTDSPFGYKSKYSWDFLFDVATVEADWISVHTSPLFGGGFNNISKAKKYIEKLGLGKPVLAKGYHRSDSEIQRCLDEGADYVLCVDFLPSLHLINRCLLEISDYNYFLKVSSAWPDLHYVHNLRDLSTGLLKKYNDFHVWREARPDVWLCQASGIKHKFNVNPKANAFIVGSDLVEYVESL